MALPSYYDYADSVDEQNFTDTSYVERATLDFTAPANGDYLIIVSATARCNSTTLSIMVRAQLDDTTTIMEMYFEPQNATNSYESITTFYVASSLASGAHYVDVDAYVESGATGYIKNIRIIVIRYDDWLTTSGMKGYVATEASVNIASAVGTATTLETLNITPDTTGNYLILGFGELDTNSTSYSAFVTLNITSGTEYLPINTAYGSLAFDYMGWEAKDTSDWIPFLIGGIVSLTSGASRTITLDGYRSSTSVTPGVRKRRILAIRLGACTDANSGEDTTESTYTNTTYSTSYYKGTLSFTPSASAYYLIIAMTAHFSQSASYYSGVRLEQTAGTATGTLDEELMVPKQVGTTTQDTYGFNTALVKQLAASTQTFYNEVLVSGGTARMRMGVICAIQLEEYTPPAGQIDTLLGVSWDSGVDAVMGVEDTACDDVMGVDTGETT